MLFDKQSNIEEQGSLTRKSSRMGLSNANVLIRPPLSQGMATPCIQGHGPKIFLRELPLC
jgi:hypothetical protein